MKKTKSAFYKSALFSYAVFIMGNAVIALPDNSSNQFTVLGLAVSGVVSLAFIALLSMVSYFVTEGKTGRFSAVLKTVIWIAVALLAIFSAADTLTDFTSFVSNNILTEVPLFVTVVTFTAVLVYFFFKRQEDSLKFSFLCFIFTAVLVVFFFFATSKNFEWENLYINKIPDFKELKASVMPYFLKVSAPCIILPFYHRLVFSNRSYSACCYGVITGYVLLFLCVLPSVLLFTPSLAGRLSYPYASAISTVTVGKIFTRLDGFSYFIYFAAALIKINICLFTVKKAIHLISD